MTTHGDIAPPGSCSLGLFHDDTRILSHYVLRVAGGAPALLSAQTPRPYGAHIDLAVNDLPFGGDRLGPAERHPRPAGAGPERPTDRAAHAHQLPAQRRSTTGSSSTFGVRLRRHLRGARLAPGGAGPVLRARCCEDDCIDLRLPRPRRTRAPKRASASATPPDPADRPGRALGRCGCETRSAGRAGVGGVAPRTDERPHRAAAGAGRAPAQRLDGVIPRLAASGESLDHRCPGVRRSAPPRRRRPPGALRGGGRRARALRRDSVVLHHLRPRRDHHLAADAAAQPRDRPATRCATSRAARACARTRSPRSSPARSSTSSVGARWLAPARSRTCPTTAAWTPRRSGSSCCTRPGAGPGTPRWSRAAAARGARAGVDRPLRRSRRRRLRRVRSAPRRRAWSTRGGRTRATACPSPTAACPSRRSRWSRCRGTSTTRRSGWPSCTSTLGSPSAPPTLRREAAELREPDPGPVLARGAGHVRAGARWRQAPAADGRPPTPATCSGAGCRRRTRPSAMRGALARARISSPAGASAR